MGLTRTRFSQADTAVAKIQDPITVLNSGSSIANVDVGFLINRNQGTKSNVAVYWNEAGTELTVGLTANTGVPNGNIALTSYANLRAGTIYGNIGGGSDQANVYITGSMIPTANVAYDLGSTDHRFKSLWISGSTIHIGSERISVDSTGKWNFTSRNKNLSISDNSVFDNVTITGNLNLQGNATQFDSNNLIVHDSIIQLHTPADLAPLTGDDGRDIGIDFHYYKSHDNHAFLGWSNDSGYLEWYDSGYETASNIFVGNTYGAVKTGQLVLANNVPSTSKITGALRISGGAGIEGNLYVGTNLVVDDTNVRSNLVTAATNINTLFSTSTVQDANLGVATTNISTVNANVTAANTQIQTLDSNLGTTTTTISVLQANVGAYESWANTRIQTLDANIGAITNGLVDYATLFSNAATQQAQINNIVATSNANAHAYLTSTGATVTAATNATRTEISSNINGGTAYVTFVSAAAGNVAQHVNTALTYNPSTGNLTAYGLITTTGLYWANGSPFVSSSYGNTEVAAYLPINSTITGIQANIGAYQAYANANIGSASAGNDTINANVGAYQTYTNANIGTTRTNLNTLDANVGAFHTYANLHFSDSNYGNTQVATYLPVYSGTIGGTLSGSSQPNVTDVGTLTGLDVAGTTYLTGFVTADGTGGSTPQYSVKLGNADGEKIAFATRGTAGYGVGIEVLKDDESGYGKLNISAAETHFNVINASAAVVQNNAIVIQANGMVTLDATTTSTSTTTGALVVRGGAGISGALNIGTSLTVDNSTYGNVVTTQFGSVFAYAYGPNNYSLIQAWSQGTQGIGLNAFGTQLYSSGAITFRTGATVRDKDYPTGGTTGVQIAANGAIINTTGIASTSTGTGAVIVAGGVGISGNVYAGKIYTTDGLHWAGNGVAFSSGGGAGLTYTAATAPPTTGNIKGDQWYSTTTDVLYEYISDGASSYWVDIQSQTLAATASAATAAESLHPFLLAGM